MKLTDVFPLTLPADSRLPPDAGTAAPLAPLPFAPPFPSPRTADEANALAMWINAHQLFFLSLCAGTSTADRAARALAAGRFDDAATAIHRIADIRLGATAMTDAAGGISPALYASYIRPTMAGMRADFSGVSSRDNWRFDDATQSLAALSRSALEASPNELVAQAWAADAHATKTWWDCHARVMRRLVGEPISLARMAYEKMVATGDHTGGYGEFQKILRGEAAIDTNDEFFGVRRAPTTRAALREAADRLTAWLTPRLEADGDLDRTMLDALRRGVAAVHDALDQAP